MPVRPSARQLPGPLVATLFIGSGLAGMWAAWKRWHVCLQDAAACAATQDHRYDYGIPADPWVPIPGAAELEGLSLLALALALVLIAGRMGGLLLFRLLALLPAAYAVLVAVPTLLSALAGTPVQLPEALRALPAAWYLVGPVVLVILAAESAARDPRVPGLAPKVMTLVWAGLALATPVVEGYLLGLLAPSVGTSPGEGMLRSALVLLCGVVLVLPARVLPWPVAYEPPLGVTRVRL